VTRAQAEHAIDLAKAAEALLMKAGCDKTGAVKDKRYRRNKRAESKRLRGHWRAERKKLGKLGAASPVRTIAPDSLLK
jgi:hypothetical protein